MNAISLWQPHASALFVPRLGSTTRMLKGLETRHWAPATRYVGKPLAIHAALTQVNPKTREKLREWWIQRVHRNGYNREAFARAGFENYSDLPFGCIIGHGVLATVERALTRVRSLRVDSIELDWGDYSTPERFTWEMINMTLLPEPVPFTGHQGFFEWPTP